MALIDSEAVEGGVEFGALFGGFQFFGGGVVALLRVSPATSAGNCEPSDPKMYAA